MKPDQKQFDNSLRAYKHVKINGASKERIRLALMAHVRNGTHNLSIAKPHFPIVGNFRKSIVTVFAICLVYGGTAFAAEPSLPGDFLYPVKTHITEPLVKLTKVSGEAKMAYELALAGKRIKEMQKLVEEGTMTDSKAIDNFTLFEKHIQQYRRHEKNSRDVTATIDLHLKDYREVILSTPSLSSFYEDSAKATLQPIPPSTDRNKEVHKSESALMEKTQSSESILKNDGTRTRFQATTTADELNFMLDGREDVNLSPDREEEKKQNSTNAPKDDKLQKLFDVATTSEMINIRPEENENRDSDESLSLPQNPDTVVDLLPTSGL